MMAIYPCQAVKEVDMVICLLKVVERGNGVA